VDSFELRVASAAEKARVGGVAHAHAWTRFGDNLDDEWFIVDLLVHLSKRHPVPSPRLPSPICHD